MPLNDMCLKLKFNRRYHRLHSELDLILIALALYVVYAMTAFTLATLQ